MPTEMFLMVLGAALVHATWNALVKTDRDRLALIRVMSLTQLVVSLCLIPFVAVSAVYVLFMWKTRVSAGARMDNRFVLSGTMWIWVALNSLWRLLFPQGLLALGLLAWVRRRRDWIRIAFAFAWILLGIAPHSFLTYMPQLASRHTYLASGGLALLVGAAMVRLSKHISTVAFGAVCVTAVLLNVEIIWVKKMSQFRERGEPTELLKTAARAAAGPITVECTPVPDLVVESALESVGAKAIIPKPENHTANCFAIEYADRQGAIVRVNRNIGGKHGMFY